MCLHFIIITIVYLFHYYDTSLYILGFLVAHMVKHLPVMWETQVQSLDQEDTLEKGVPTHPSVLVWRIPWIEEPDQL